MRLAFLYCFLLLIVFAATPTVWGHGEDNLEIIADCHGLDRTVLHIELHGFLQDNVRLDGKNYLQISLDGEGRVMRDGAGYPQLPGIYRSLIIPDMARMETRVISSEYYEIADVDVIPNKGTILRTVDPASVPYTFNEVYERNAFFPETLTSLRDPYILHDVRGVVVEVFPFQYNPVSRTLRVYTHLEVEVVANGVGTNNLLDRRSLAPKVDRSFSSLYKHHFLNTQGFLTEPPAENGDMLVISHSSFMSAVQPLVNWKNSRGISTTLVDVSSIGNNSSSIKTYITNLYNSSNLTFVLLVGDGSEVVSGYANGGESDAYYSTITGDAYPDLFVGRFSAQNTSQVTTQVTRTIDYETDGHDLSMGGWNTYGLGVASNQGSGVGHYGEADDEHMNLIRGELLAYGFSKVDQIYDPSGTSSQVASALNEGRRLANYCGHGSTTSWSSTGFSTSHVNNLTNVGKLPFIFSVACVNGDFNGNTCFAEAWLRATYNGDPTGAIACYMSTVNQSWVPPMYAEGNHSTSGKYGAAERFCSESHETLGALWYGGSCCMMDIAGSSGESEFENWVIFGDPSLALYETTQPAITMNFPEGLPSGCYPPGPDIPITVEIIPGLETYAPGSGYLYYRFNSGDGFSSTPFTSLGGNQYEVTIPNVQPGDAPEYYLVAQGNGGTPLAEPADAPSSVHVFDVGFVEMIMEDTFEQDLGWTFENTAVSTGEWERANPAGTGAQPENDHSVPGTLCFVTGATGGGDGDDDLDGGPTRLISPSINLEGADADISYYYYFYHSDNGGQEPMQIHVTNNITGWVEVTNISHTPSWTQGSFKVSDYVTPSNDVQVRFTADDSPNDSIVEALVDDFIVERYILDPVLWADGYSISASSPAAIAFTIDATSARAGRPYLLLGSLSGTAPGTPVPGGGVLPINWDAFTDMVLLLLNGPVFSDFLGTLDGSGEAIATLNIQGPLNSGLVGKDVHFAYTLGEPFDFQSNPIKVSIEP